MTIPEKEREGVLHPHWNADQRIGDDIYYRIPGRDFARGEVTHKRLKDMNRQERRAMRKAGRLLPSPPEPSP